MSLNKESISSKLNEMKYEVNRISKSLEKTLKDLDYITKTDLECGSPILKKYILGSKIKDSECYSALDPETLCGEIGTLCFNREGSLARLSTNRDGLSFPVIDSVCLKYEITPGEKEPKFNRGTFDPNLRGFLIDENDHLFIGDYIPKKTRRAYNSFLKTIKDP